MTVAKDSEFMAAFIRHVVEIAEREKHGSETILKAEVQESNASPRDVALTFSSLTNAMREFLATAEAPEGQVACSFCHKNQRDVRSIVAGPSANICDECVEICVKIVAGKKPSGKNRVFDAFSHFLGKKP